MGRGTIASQRARIFTLKDHLLLILLYHNAHEVISKVLLLLKSPSDFVVVNIKPLLTKFDAFHGVNLDKVTDVVEDYLLQFSQGLVVRLPLAKFDKGKPFLFFVIHIGVCLRFCNRRANP